MTQPDHRYAINETGTVHLMRVDGPPRTRCGMQVRPTWQLGIITSQYEQATCNRCRVTVGLPRQYPPPTR